VAQVSPEVDGVAVLSTITDPTPFLSAYGRQVGDLPRHVVGGGAAFAWKSLALAGAAGTAVAYDLPPTSPRPAWRRQVRGFREAFPGLPTEFATDPLYMHLGTAMEAVAQGIERSHGELGRQQRLFRDALSELTLDAPAGPVRIDANGQAVVDVHIERVTADGRRAPLRLVEGVEQTFGGAFGRSTPPPTRALPRCERRPPPPWARG
jgi:hypothetical protein